MRVVVEIGASASDADDIAGEIVAYLIESGREIVSYWVER